MAITLEQRERFAKNARRVRASMLASEKSADELCASGDTELSAMCHEMAAHLRRAYALGQSMKLVSTLRSGEK